MNSFSEFITKYSADALDAVLVQDSKTKILEAGKKFLSFKFDGAKTVKVFILKTSGLGNYKRGNEGDTANGYANYTGTQAGGDGYPVGGLHGEWESFELQWDRATQLRIDAISNEQEAGLLIGNAITQFDRTAVVPEMDALRFSYIASQANATLGNLIVNDAPSILNDSTGIIHKFNAAFQYLTENAVPVEDQIIYVTPAIMTMIRNTAELQKWLTQQDYRYGDITFTIDAYMGRPITEVTPDKFVTDVVAGSNGFYAGTNSKAINFIIMSRKAAIPYVKLVTTKVFEPGMVQDFDGWKVNYHVFHGCFVPREKVPAIYVSLSANAGTQYSGILRLALVSGAADTQWVLNGAYTLPAGKMGTVVYSATAFTLNTTYAIDGTTIKSVAIGQTVTESAAITSASKYYFALLDANGLAVATSNGQINLPVHA